MERINLLDPNPFIDGPGDYLAKQCALEIGKVTQFQSIFSEYIDPYKRMDYPVRAFPAVRLYCEQMDKESDNSWLTGNITADIIFPPSIRREEMQNLPDIVSSAMLQQFRRQSFFNTLSTLVPGLNELGRRFSIDKKLGFEWESELVPLTQITINFKLDLRQWDQYLESTDRTVDEPFKRTLGNLERIVTSIQALRDDDSLEGTALQIDQVAGGEST